MEEFGDSFGRIEAELKKLEERINKLKTLYKKKLSEYDRLKRININEMSKFFSHFWAIVPKDKSKNEYWVIVPKFIDFQVGFLETSDDGYNYFVLNKYSQWLFGVPEELRDAIRLKKPEPLSVIDGVLTFPEGYDEVVRVKYGKYLSTIGKTKAKIKLGSEFDLIAEIIRKGSLPFVPQPVSSEDLRRAMVNFKMEGKWSFQKKAVETFMKTGAVGIFYPTGAGKSFIAMYIMDSLKGRKLIVVPTRDLIEQWKSYLREYASRLVEETDIVTYQAYEKIRGNEYTITVYDECWMLPADTFSRFATIRTKYRLGISATIWREDGREDYIIALTGRPLGLDWKSYLKFVGKTFHEVNLYIVSTQNEKLNLIKQLVDPSRKTLIFCDYIDFGKKIARVLTNHIYGKKKTIGELGSYVPFIHGEITPKRRMEMLKKSDVVVASRVADLGLSIKDLEHIIEAMFLMGSRTQEVQRTGRLLHSVGKIHGHDILMTEEEFYRYKKRLHGLVEKGFKINIRTTPGLPRRIIEEKRLVRRKTVKRRAKVERRVKEEEEKIIKGFVRRKVAQMTKIVNELTPLERRILRFLIIARRASMKKIASAIGVDDIKNEIMGMLKTGVVKRDSAGRIQYNIPSKIKKDLAIYKAGKDDIKTAIDEIEKIIREWKD